MASARSVSARLSLATRGARKLTGLLGISKQHRAVLRTSCGRSGSVLLESDLTSVCGEGELLIAFESLRESESLVTTKSLLGLTRELLRGLGDRSDCFPAAAIGREISASSATSTGVMLT